MWKYEHLKIDESFADKIDKVEGVFRVGFLVVMVHKKTESKGIYWQKECIEKVAHIGETEEERLNSFEQIL